MHKCFVSNNVQCISNAIESRDARNNEYTILLVKYGKKHHARRAAAGKGQESESSSGLEKNAATK
jgi:hypothetical protein